MISLRFAEIKLEVKNALIENIGTLGAFILQALKDNLKIDDISEITKFDKNLLEAEFLQLKKRGYLNNKTINKKGLKMNLSFRERAKREFENLRKATIKEDKKTSVSEIIALTIGIIGFIILVVGYVSVNASWLTLVALIAAEIFGYTHPIFSLTSISIVGTPFLMSVSGIFSVILGMVLIATAEKMEID